MVVSAPNMANPTSTLMRVAIAKVDERNSFSGRSASSPIIRSMAMNAMMPAMPRL